MIRALRQLSRLLRLPVLALLLFAVVANPVLAAVGDIHESAQISSSHADPEHCDVSDDTVNSVVDQDRDSQDAESTGDLLHALVHGAHACGHPVAVASPSFFVEPVSLAAPAPVHNVHPLDSLQPLSLTRPPITA